MTNPTATNPTGHTMQVPCPTCGEEVTATDAGFHATEVALSRCSCFGFAEIERRFRKSWFYGYVAGLDDEAAGVRHSEGLVTMVGGR